jgi:hypothetical protein
LVHTCKCVKTQLAPEQVDIIYSVWGPISYETHFGNIERIARLLIEFKRIVKTGGRIWISPIIGNTNIQILTRIIDAIGDMKMTTDHMTDRGTHWVEIIKQ